jgi:TPR repeat protein
MSAAIIHARLRAVSGRPEARLRLADRLAEHGNGIKAVRHIAVAAKDGLAQAQAKLGVCYLRGLGVPVCLVEARYWLEQAAEGGNTLAQTELASLALSGVSGPYDRGAAFPEPDDRSGPNYPLAADLARRAAHAGSPEAKALLAAILGLAPWAAEDGDDAAALNREAAQAGWPLGQLGHAMTMLGEGTEASTRVANGLLSAAAASGLPTAHFLFGAMAETGTGMMPDMAVAVTHYRAAAEAGHNGAKTRLGLALLTGRGTKRNLVEAETWLRRAANHGDALAAASLGDFHASPERDPASLEEAAHWYRLAAEHGYPGAARQLARIIASGAEGQPDPTEIATWLETAIERGDTAAWPELGGMIASASLPRTQLPALHSWLQRMIREDRPEAGFYVGVCVNNGIGTPADAKLARRYYLWAAGEGVLEGMVAAGEMLLNGRGGKPEPSVARALFEYAAKRNHAGARFALGIMAGNDRDSAMVHFRQAAALGHQKARVLIGGVQAAG